MRRRALLPVVVVLLATACSGGLGAAPTSPPTSPPTSQAASPPASTPVPTPKAVPGTTPGRTGHDVALSEPVEDSVYPEVGDPGVDALHYDLTLDWDPRSDTLTGREALTFRATATADEVRLDLGAPLEVGSVTLDGEAVEVRHTGKDLVVRAPVEADRRYLLELDYRGTPEPVPAPTTRADFEALGFTIDAEHQTWTMQEPYGAFTWYAVNDQPADKALYDFTLSVPAPWTGVANGEQVLDRTRAGVHTTAYRLAEPAASYLVTLAFGDYVSTEDTGPGGVPITSWTFRDGDPRPGLATAPDAMRWLEARLGPYPFDTAGFLLVDSSSGMETQTMITLGDDAQVTSAPVVLHELAHHWWGDQVTPSDWRDLWMNEGMATYLQLLWEAEQSGGTADAYLEALRPTEAYYREQAGPPGDYDPDQFAVPNVYYSGALLWHVLRKRVGDETFWRAVRRWPTSQDNRSTDRKTLLAHLERETGEQLDELWDAWLLGETSPPLG